MGIHQNISKWEKQKLMELLKVQFEETLAIIPIDKTKVLLIPKNISLFDIAVENYHLKEELVSKKNSDEAEDRIFNAANLLREEIIVKSLQFHGHPKHQSYMEKTLLFHHLLTYFPINLSVGVMCVEIPTSSKSSHFIKICPM